MTATSEAERLEPLVQRAQAEVEAALRGASLCSVSREPGRGSADVKVCEGRWYTLRDIQRELERGAEPAAALASVGERLRVRTPSGSAWEDYRRGAGEALDLARTTLDLPPRSAV